MKAHSHYKSQKEVSYTRHLQGAWHTCYNNESKTFEQKQRQHIIIPIGVMNPLNGVTVMSWTPSQMEKYDYVWN